MLKYCKCFFPTLALGFSFSEKTASKKEKKRKRKHSQIKTIYKNISINLQ